MEDVWSVVRGEVEVRSSDVGCCDDRRIVTTRFWNGRLSLVGKNSCEVFLPNPADDSPGVVLISGKPELAFLADDIKDLGFVSAQFQ